MLQSMGQAQRPDTTEATKLNRTYCVWRFPHADPVPVTAYEGISWHFLCIRVHPLQGAGLGMLLAVVTETLKGLSSVCPPGILTQNSSSTNHIPNSRLEKVEVEVIGWKRMVDCSLPCTGKVLRSGCEISSEPKCGNGSVKIYSHSLN